MSDEKDIKTEKTTETPKEEVVVKAVEKTAEKSADSKAPVSAGKAPARGGFNKGGAGQNGDRPKNMRERRPRRGGPRRDAHKEFEQKIIGIRRVTRVVAGGRRFSFSVAMVIGDRKGKVGVGLGKAGDTALAIDKAIRDAKKNMIKVSMTKENSIAHDIDAKYCASRINILPAPGKGIVAGSSVRTVLEFAGIKDVTAKIFSRSKNQLNNAKATIKALETLNV